MRTIQFVLFCFGLFALPQGAAFVQPPAISRVDGKAVITFSVSAPIDVEVSILDNSGKVVRHLAAGVLGGDTLPPEPLVRGLSQSVSWDGLDDYGRLSLKPPFKARVRLGVAPKFEKRIHIKDAAMIPPASLPAWDPATYLTTNNLGWGPDTVVDTGRVITTTSSVLFTGRPGLYSGLHLNDGGIKMIELCVSKETDSIVFQEQADYNGGGPWMVSLSGITGIKKNVYRLGYTRPGQDAGLAFGEAVMDWHGRFFFMDRGNGGGGGSPDLRRFNFDGTPINYSWGTNMVDLPYYSNDGIRQPGYCNGPDGSFYVAHYPYGAVVTPLPMIVSKFDSTGAILKDILISASTAIQGVRVDLKGNVFVGLKLKPITDTVPQEIRGLISGAFNEQRPYSQAAVADEVYASIVKFPPQGGSVTYSSTGSYYAVSYLGGTPTPSAKNRMTVNGAQWVHFGNSFIFSKDPANNLTGCLCYNPRFDVDRFGRVVYPDPFQNEFRALDNNGNLLFRVHNRDLFPSVNVGSIVAVEVTDRAVYLGDHINNQIIVMVWSADAEQILELPPAMAEKLSPSQGTLEVSNFPNPFNHSTTIQVWGVGSLGSANLAIYDMSGRRVADLTPRVRSRNAQIKWNGKNALGKDISNGYYCCRLTLGAKTVNRTMLLVR